MPAEPTTASERRPSMTPDQCAGTLNLLRESLAARDLFRRSILYYVAETFLAVFLLIGSVSLLFVLESTMLRMLMAVPLAIASTRLSFLGHDAGHGQVFRSRRANDRFMLLMGPFLGLGRSWWLHTHNLHHKFPNDSVRDPHASVKVLAFTVGQQRAKSEVTKSIIRFQVYYYLPLLLLEGLWMRLNSIYFLKRRRLPHRCMEAYGILIYWGSLMLIASTAFTTSMALLFSALYLGLNGLYMGLIFAPNHKGMPAFETVSNNNFLRLQTATTRNVAPSPAIDFWFGGLNYQIEHHLFPRLPRNRLREARDITRAFCAEHEIGYCELSLTASYREVFSHLGRTARRADGWGELRL